MSDELQRTHFELWLQGTAGWKTCAKRGNAMYLRTRFDGSYADYRVNDRWLAYKAAWRTATLLQENVQ